MPPPSTLSIYGLILRPAPPSCIDFSALFCGFPRGHFSFSGHADLYWPCLVPKALFHRLRRRQLLLRTFRFHFGLHLCGAAHGSKELLACSFRPHLPRIRLLPARDGAVFFLCRLDHEFSVLRLGEDAFEARIRPGIESSPCLGATGSSYMERGRLEPVRRSLFLRFVSVLAAGPRSPLAAAVVAHSCRVLVDVSCLFWLLCGPKPRSLVDRERRCSRSFLAECLEIQSSRPVA